MKKKLIGRIGALLMAATMAFSSGTPVFADEAQPSQEYEDEDHSVIEEGTGYEIEKGTPLDGGGYTTWVSVNVSKLDGNTLCQQHHVHHSKCGYRRHLDSNTRGC